MRALSDTTVSLIDSVTRLAGDRARPGSKNAQVNEVASQLDLIAETGEWLAIPRVISLALDGRRGVAEAAAKAVKRLRGAVRIEDVSVFDRTFRELSPHLHPEYSAWCYMRPADLKPVSALTGGAVVLQLAMCHPNGHVRAEAIWRSAACSDGAEIPFLLLRCNDWVDAVRALARSALRARLRVENLPDLIRALPMLDQMRKWGRLGDRSILDDIDGLLASAEATSHLLERLESPDRFLRRAAYRRLVVGSRAHPRGVLERALSDSDPAIRTWAGRRLCEADREIFLGLAERLLVNRLGAIRAATARRLSKLGRPLPWRILMLDTHSGVRAVAQQVALDGGVAPDRLYREAILSFEGKRLGAALIGLGETGGSGDVDAVRPHLAGASPRVRRSALHALASLKAEDIVGLCLEALSDASPSVAHAARDLLLGDVGYVSPASVWAAFEKAGTAWGRRDALAVLSELDHWCQLPYLLRAFMVSQPAVKEKAGFYLTRWVGRQNRVFTSPSVEVERELRELVQAPAFSERFRREVCLLLERFR